MHRIDTIWQVEDPPLKVRRGGSVWRAVWVNPAEPRIFFGQDARDLWDFLFHHFPISGSDWVWIREANNTYERKGVYTLDIDRTITVGEEVHPGIESDLGNLLKL